MEHHSHRSAGPDRALQILRRVQEVQERLALADRELEQKQQETLFPTHYSGGGAVPANPRFFPSLLFPAYCNY